MRNGHALLLAGLAACLAAAPARAEVDHVDIVSTFGLAQFPGRLAYDHKFIQNRAAKAGLANLKVSFKPVASGVVVSDLLLAGRANVGVGGNVPLFHLWDKTKGRVKGIMAFSQGDGFLITCDPRLKSVHDYTSSDRIAMTGVKTSTYAMLLQMEAAKAFGWDKRGKFDNLAVSMSNPDGMGAILSCKTAVKSHMTILPHSTVELTSGKGRIVFSSNSLLDGPYTFVVAFTTTRFHDDNPKTYQAVVDGFGDAMDYIRRNPEQAAAEYMKDEPFIGTKDMLIKLIEGKTPDHFAYGPAPRATKTFIDFMSRSGTIGTPVKSWRDVWFKNLWNQPGT